ncbi:MAG: bifunctional ornithine acetyltransferase/N-acetylglutamate synthase, partial [Thermoguttaceae bacterium]
MPMDKIRSGVAAASKLLAADESAFLNAARGIMTTDTVEKTASRTFVLQNGTEITLAGFCKGAAMIAPNMRTMLALIMTDLALEPELAQKLISESVEDSFNCISVDGHTSPSDTVLLMANGAAFSGELSNEDLAVIKANLVSICQELAKKIPADGEGASHLITIDVLGCKDRESAKTIAKKIANDPLVKAAIFGADPNWGRIVSAAGTAEIPFDTTKVGLFINGVELFRDGTPIPFDTKAVSDSIRNNRDTHFKLSFGEGDAGITFWTTDLTCEYVRLNSDYTT